MSAKEKIETIHSKLAKIQGEIGKIHKDAKNPFHKSNYESLEAILAVITPLNTSEGLALYFNVEFLEGLGSVLKGTLTDGQDSIVGICPLSADGKNMMQAYGSAMSYGRRYIMRNMYNLNTTDDDGESSSAKDKKLTQVRTTKIKEYIIPEDFKAFAGKKIKEVEKEELHKYIQELKIHYIDKKKKEPMIFVNLQKEAGYEG